MPLMTLGLFCFEVTTAPLDSVRRSGAWRWPSQERAGGPLAHQYMGPGEDTRTLKGVLMPELTGGPVHLDTLRKMAAGGKAWLLIDGRGRSLGWWVILKLQETATALLADGTARRTEFTMELARYADGRPGGHGYLPDSLPKGLFR